MSYVNVSVQQYNVPASHIYIHTYVYESSLTAVVCYVYVVAQLARNVYSYVYQCLYNVQAVLCDALNCDLTTVPPGEYCPVCAKSCKH